MFGVKLVIGGFLTWVAFKMSGIGVEWIKYFIDELRPGNRKASKWDD